MLDRRGRWLIKGSRIANEAVLQFINRNYECDAQGRWFFQNGPQRAFITLQYTPWVLRIEPREESHKIVAHTGSAIEQVHSAFIDDQGSMLLQTNLGIGLVCDQDLSHVMDCLRDERSQHLSDQAISDWLSGSGTSMFFVWNGSSIEVQSLAAGDVPTRFGFVPDPRPAPGEPDC